MNKEHSRYWLMFNSVQSTLDTNTGAWSTIPILAESKNQFDEIIQRIDVIYNANHDNSKAITRQKNDIKEAAIIKISTLASTIAALGDVIEDETLKQFSSVTKSTLDTIKESEAVNMASAVISIAKVKKEELVPFGISETAVTEAETSLDDFKHLIGESRIVRNSVYASIKEADQLFSEGNKLLRNRFDKVMKIFKQTQPKLYDLYIRSRVILN